LFLFSFFEKRMINNRKKKSLREKNTSKGMKREETTTYKQAFAVDVDGERMG